MLSVSAVLLPVQGLPGYTNPSTYVWKETQYAWECIQLQCQKVLTGLLQSQTGTVAATHKEKAGQCRLIGHTMLSTLACSR